MKSIGVTIQINANEQYFPVVLFIMLDKVVLTFMIVEEILWCDHYITAMGIDAHANKM